MNVDVQVTLLNYPAMAWLPVTRGIGLTDPGSSLLPVRQDNLINHQYNFCQLLVY